MQTEGTPANVLATLANNLLGVQQAFTATDGITAKSLQSAASYDQGAPQVDPIPKVRSPLPPSTLVGSPHPTQPLHLSSPPASDIKRCTQ